MDTCFKVYATDILKYFIYKFKAGVYGRCECLLLFICFKKNPRDCFICTYYCLHSQARGTSGTVYECFSVIQTVPDLEEKEKSILYNMEKERERDGVERENQKPTVARHVRCIYIVCISYIYMCLCRYKNGRECVIKV